MNNRIVAILGGAVLAGVLGLIGVLIGIVQIGQTERDSVEEGKTNATIIAIQQEQLDALKELATIQAIPSSSNPAANANATIITQRQNQLETEIANLESTRVALDESVDITQDFTVPIPKVTETPFPDGMLFFDDFENAAMPVWVNEVTRSSIQNGEIHLADSGYLLAGSNTWENYSVRASFRLISGEIDFGLVARVRDHETLYICQIWHDQIWLVKQGDNLAQGTFEWLTTTSYQLNFGELYNLRMDVHDKDISCYLNGVMVGSAIDSSYSTGKFGFRVYNTEVAIDSVEVFELP